MKGWKTVMYKKKDRKAMYITLGVVAAVIILLITLTAVKNAQSRKALDVTEEVPTHEILIYKTVAEERDPSASSDLVLFS